MNRRASILIGLLLLASLCPTLTAGPFGGTEDFNHFGKQFNYSLQVSLNGFCAAVAAINSFIYLENQYPTVYGNMLTPLITGVQPNQIDYFDTTLFAVNYYDLATDNQEGWNSYVTAKQAWFNQYAPNTTWITSQYAGSAQNNSVPTLAFLGQEMMDKEDVEIFVSGAIGAHALTVIGVTCPNICIIQYQDPNMPNVVQTSQLFTDPNGKLEFQGLPGSGDNFNFYTIDAAFSESPLPEPSTPSIKCRGSPGMRLCEDANSLYLAQDQFERLLCGANDLANMRCMPDTPEQQLKGFIAKFDPAVGIQIRRCRSAMRKRFPRANELVYDNYNFFVIGYCTTERPSDCVVSLAANSKGIGLSFYHGATLPDPHRILQGSGNQNRFVRLDGVATLGMWEVQELLDAAEAQAEPPFVKAGRGKLIIRSISEKQRPRR